MTKKRSLAIDADGHVCEPVDLWQKRLEPKYRDRGVRVAKTSDGTEALLIDDKPCIEILWNRMAFLSSVGHSSDEVIEASSYLNPKVTHLGAYEPKARLQALDEQQMEAAFLYPTLGLFWPSEVRDFKLAAACARAYNDWIYDFCQTDTARLKAIAQIHLGDVDEAVKEVHRVAKLGFPGLFTGPKVYHNGHPFLGDPYYDPFWAAVQECDLPVSIHIMFPQEDFSWKESGYPEEFGFGSIGWYALTNVQQPVIRAITSLLACGVFQKFPKLKVLLMETHAGWVGNYLERLDSKYKFIGWLEKDLKIMPSELFKKHCWVGMDADEKTAKDAIPYIGEDRILFASDFPHGDATLHPVEEAREALEGLSEKTIEKIMSRNILEVYQAKVSAQGVPA